MFLEGENAEINYRLQLISAMKVDFEGFPDLIRIHHCECKLIIPDIQPCRVLTEVTRGSVLNARLNLYVKDGLCSE